MRLPRLVDRALRFFGYQKRSSTVFAGAQGNRLTMDWWATILSADQEAKSNLRILRARSRELVRNSPTAKCYLNLLATNVIGHEGIKYQSKIRNNDNKLNDQLNDKIEDAWKDWCKAGTCTVDGKLSFRGVQDLILRGAAMDGEGFVRMVRNFPDNKYKFALQLIDPDQVDHLWSRAKVKNGENEIRMSVEVNEWGKPVAYWVSPEHPYDIGGTLERQRIPAKEIVHVYDPYRVNQSRGITWFHCVMLGLKMLDGYFEAELVAARTGAAKMGFLRFTDPATYEAPDPDKRLTIDANPGTIEQLPPGLEFQSWNVDHPANAFPAFVMAILRQVATGLGVSYNALANDLVGVNFSSIRSGLLMERDQWRRLQSWFAETFMQRVFDEWLEMAIVSRAIVLDSRDQERFHVGRWVPRGWPWVDPLKDTQAEVMAINAGLRSRTKVTAEAGEDFEETIEEIAEENDLAKQYRVTLSSDVKKPSTTGEEQVGAEGTGNPPGESGDGASGGTEGGRTLVVPSLVSAVPAPRVNGKAVTQ